MRSIVKLGLRGIDFFTRTGEINLSREMGGEELERGQRSADKEETR